MRFLETDFQGAYLIEIEPIEDERGFFARTWCAKEFAAHGLDPALVQCNLSFNAKRGTLRGMHYQTPPYEEAKLVSCSQGSIYDVIIDLRRQAPTFGHWQGFELSAMNRRMLYIPKGFAHGFQTLEDNTRVFYQMSEFYYPECASGVRWDDPAFSIEWPLAISAISEKDRRYASFEWPKKPNGETVNGGQ